MAALVKVNGYYYLQFFNRSLVPKKKSVPLKTKTKSTAERLKVKLEDAVAAGKFNPWVNNDWFSQLEAKPQTLPTKLGDCVKEFLDGKKHLAPSTQKNYKEMLERFRDYVGASVPVQTITPKQVAEWLDAFKGNDVSRKTYVRHVSTLFNQLLKQGRITANPCKQVALKKVPHKFPKFLTLEEVDRLIGSVESYLREKPCLRKGEIEWLIPVVRCNVYLGLRVSELCNLRWSAVDLAKRTVTVRNTETFTTKSGKERVVPVADVPLAVLSELDRQRANREQDDFVFRSPHGQLDRIHVGRLFKKFARRAGFGEKIKFHSLRHTACSLLAMRGASVEAIRLFAGHSSIQVSQKYMHLAPDVYHSQITDAFSGRTLAA